MPKCVDDLVVAAKKQSLLVHNYAAHVEQRTYAMREDFKNLAESLATDYEQNKELADISGAALQIKVLQYIDTEISHLAEFDKARMQPGAVSLPYQISSQKLSFSLPKIREQLTGEENESAVVKLVSGEFKPNPTFEEQYPILRTDSFFGSNCATYEAGKMLCVKFAISDKTIADFNDTSIVHISPYDKLPECFVNSGSKFFTKVNNTPGFGFYHAGYAFGGQRGETVQYKLGPEDCSSLLANILYQTANPDSTYGAAPMQTSTIHQLYAWRARQNNDKMFIDRSADGYIDDIVKYWDTILELQTPATDAVMAGDIYLLRTALKDKGDFDMHASGGGHTGVVIGEDPSDPNNILIFECARNLEQENINLEYPEKTVWGVGGAGIGSFSKRYEELTDDRVKRNMLLRPKH